MNIQLIIKHLFYVLLSVMVAPVLASEVILPNINTEVLSKVSADLEPSTYLYDEDGNVYGQDQPVDQLKPSGDRVLNIATPEANRKKVESAGKGMVNRSITTMSSPPPQYSFQGCDPFNIGSGNIYELTQLEQVCSNTYSPVPIKLESLILAQSQGTNYDLVVYYYNHDTQAAEFIGGSVNPDNQDEIFSEVVPAGNYILYGVPQTAGATIEFIIGALGWENYDEHESNDTISQATPVDGSAGNYILTGNSDNQNDWDYFFYTAPTNENSALIRINSPVHILQVHNGIAWVTVNPGAAATINLGNL